MQELTAVAAAGAKAQFDRVPDGEQEKFRRTAMQVAKQQNHACCVAMLKEVAAHYGFALEFETGNRTCLQDCKLIFLKHGRTN